MKIQKPYIFHGCAKLGEGSLLQCGLMLNQWLRQYDEQQMTDNNMITIDDMT
jgi:hypothetical protein